MIEGVFLCFQTLVQYKTQLADDPIVNAHLKTLYDNLLEQNLCRIIEPFSRVQVSWYCLFTPMHLFVTLDYKLTHGHYTTRKHTIIMCYMSVYPTVKVEWFEKGKCSILLLKIFIIWFFPA